MNNLKHCRVAFSVNYSSFEDVSKSYAFELKKLPKEATNISSCFEAEEEYGSIRPILVISYYLPKTQEEIVKEEKRLSADRARKLELYMKLKAEFKDV